MKSYLKFLSRNKLYTAIEAVGLAVSLAFVILIGSYVVQQYEVAHESPQWKRTFVLGTDEFLGLTYWDKEELEMNIPEVQAATRAAMLWQPLIREGNQLLQCAGMEADADFFKVFPEYRLVEGSLEGFVGKDDVLISESLARKIAVDGDNLIGKVIKVDDSDRTIKGVFADFDGAFFMPYDIITHISGTWAAEQERNFGSIGNYTTWFRVREDADPADVSVKVKALLHNNYDPIWSAEKVDSWKAYRMDEAFFATGISNGLTRQGNAQMLRLLTVVVLLLLLSAIFNYVNLSLALTGKRAKEMATRRLVGADKRSIFFKVISESTLICGISMLLAILLAEALAPTASRILEYQVSVFKAVTPVNILLVLGFILVLGILAGIVPALLIQKAQPIEIVRGTLRLKTKTVYSKVIIVVQNVVAVVMLVSALTIGLQIRHMVSADLGYNTKDILVVDNAFGQAGQIRPLLDKWREEPCVEEVGQGDGIPLGRTSNWTMEMPDGHWVSFQQIQGDDKYFDILGLKVKQDNHQPNKWWLNEYAFKQIGIEETATEFQTAQNGTRSIGGIYYDFKIRPLEQDQSAAMIYNRGENPDDDYPWVLLVKTTGDQAAAKKRVEAIAGEVFPGRLFEAQYIEEMIEDGFADESRVLNIVLIFTLLSILVSALGLFAMSSYYMQQEIRSVSVKKVFGADYSGVLKELVLSFMKMVGIAFVIGVPIAWLIMNHWLSGYGHRIDLYWWIFVIAGLLVAIIAAISVLYQSIKTARTNPAEALKKE